MKKAILFAAVVAALASCQSKTNKSAGMDADSLSIVMSPINELTEVYEGTLPAADGPGIKYRLTLNAGVVNSDTIYTLDMTYLDAEGKGKNKTFSSKGKQQKIRKKVGKKKKPVTALKLTPVDEDIPMYFVVINDTVLRLVNEDLEEADSKENYDIVKVKKRK